MSEEKKNSKCEEGKEKKNVSVEFRVFEKKEIERKVPGKKSKCFGGGNFVKFVFTGWTFMLICKF